MCKQLGISRAGYYKWLHRDIPVQEQENQKLAELIKETEGAGGLPNPRCIKCIT